MYTFNPIVYLFFRCEKMNQSMLKFFFRSHRKSFELFRNYSKLKIEINERVMKTINVMEEKLNILIEKINSQNSNLSNIEMNKTSKEISQ
jgi:hypothetical protein